LIATMKTVLAGFATLYLPYRLENAWGICNMGLMNQAPTGFHIVRGVKGVCRGG
jgi:hypothetical protein